MLEDVQHLQGRDALRIGAEGIDVGAAIARFVRLDPFGLVRGQILVAQPAADPLEIGVDRARDLTLVKGVAPAFGDQAESAREVGVRSEEHTSELQSLMRISYAVFCLKKKIINR